MLDIFTYKLLLYNIFIIENNILLLEREKDLEKYKYKKDIDDENDLYRNFENDLSLYSELEKLQKRITIKSLNSRSMKKENHIIKKENLTKSMKLFVYY